MDPLDAHLRTQYSYYFTRYYYSYNTRTVSTSTKNAPHLSMDPEKQVMALSRLVSQRQWAPLDTLLMTSASTSATLVDDQSVPYAVTSKTIIHFALRFQAPFRIISLLSRRYPRSLASYDINGRYPIHIACEWAATPDIIAYIIETNPAAASVPDTSGKAPVHYVGEFYLEHFNREETFYHVDDAMLRVVRLLQMAAPLSVNLEDNVGMNAVEYAIHSDANIEVIRTMQRACRDDWRERSKDGDGTDGVERAASGQKSPLGKREHRDLLLEPQDGVHRTASEATSRAARMA